MGLTVETLKKVVDLTGLPVLVFSSDGEILELSPHLKNKLGIEGELTKLEDLENQAKSSQELFELISQVRASAQTSVAGGQWQVYVEENGDTICFSSVESSYWQDQIDRSSRVIEDHKRALDLSSIVAITDAKGVITYVNDTFCRISEYSREELLGKTHRIINSGFHSKEFFPNLWKTIARGEVWKGYVKNRAKSGREYWVNTTVVPFMDEKGKPYQYMAIRQDVTEEMEIKEALERQRTSSMHAEKMVSLGEMAAGIAHELGNPVASIQAWLDVIESHLLRGEVDMDRFLKTLPKVRADATRVKDIIRGMLTYARDGSKDPFMTENLSNLVSLVEDYCAFKLKKMQIKLNIEIDNPYLELECRQSELTQVFVNLIINACDAIKHLEDRWITVQVKDQGEAVRINVIDSGHGISKELTEKIFNPFFTTKPVGQGTGLGLSIVSSIVEAHKGKLSILEDSEHTNFVILLPKKQK